MEYKRDDRDSHLDVVLHVMEQIKIMQQEIRTLAMVRPPIGMQDITADRCNIPDRAIEAQVVSLRHRYNAVDCSALDQDPEKWELLAGESERYVVETRPDPDFIPATEEDENPGLWFVVDTEEDDAELFDDEDDANTACEEYNREDTTNNLAGFPFAQTYGFELESKYEVGQFASAGFLVYRYDDDKYIAGVDGGGYDQTGGHWAPLFYAKYKGTIIETETGPRRLE